MDSCLDNDQNRHVCGTFADDKIFPSLCSARTWHTTGDPRMSVSVLIVNWNSGNLLTDCLRHLQSQTVLPERVFVVDNASTDGSGEIDDPSGWIKVLRMPENIGFATGNNRALDQCSTEFVALLNPDAFPEPEWIARMLEAARQYPDAATFGSRQVCHDNPNVLDGIGDTYHISGLAWRSGHGRMQTPKDFISREIFSPCAAAAMYRRAALESIGGFDEDFFCYAEDVDLGFRLRLTGHSARYVPEAVVRHVGSATSGGKHSDFAVYYGHRNIVWTYVKNMPGMLFFIFLPLHLLMNVFSVVIFSIRGQFRVILQAKWDALKGLPNVWRIRQKLQEKRAASIREIWQALNKQFIPKT